MVNGAFCKPSSIDNSYSVTIAPLLDQEKKKYSLQVIQPYAFTLKAIQRFMQSLAYQKRAVSWSSKKRVFPSRDIQILAPEIKKHFAQASKNHRVTYQIKNANGKIRLEGDAFLTSQGMNWRITTINSATRKTDDFSIMGASWRLAPLTGQKHKTHERLKNLAQDISHWVIFTRFHPNPKRVLKEPAAKIPPSGQHQAPTSNIKERLKVLNELQREGLINKDEYEKKRREILNNF